MSRLDSFGFRVVKSTRDKDADTSRFVVRRSSKNSRGPFEERDRATVPDIKRWYTREPLISCSRVKICIESENRRKLEDAVSGGEG